MTLWSQGKENLLVLLVGVTLEVSQKLEIDLTYDSARIASGIYLTMEICVHLCSLTLC